jgi:hypothetical protein
MDKPSDPPTLLAATASSGGAVVRLSAAEKTQSASSTERNYLEIPQSSTAPECAQELEDRQRSRLRRGTCGVRDAGSYNLECSAMIQPVPQMLAEPLKESRFSTPPRGNGGSVLETEGNSAIQEFRD